MARRDIDKLVRQHKASLDRVIDRANILPIGKEFQQGIGAMARALGRAMLGRGSDPVTHADLRTISSAARHSVTRLFVGVADRMVDGVQDNLVEGVRSLARFFTGASKQGSVLDDDRKVREVVELHRREVERLRRMSAGNMAVDAAAVVRNQLAVSVKIGETKVREVVQLAVGTTDDQWWRVERVARTESSIAFNRAQDDGISALALDGMPVFKRWTELVSDLTGQPFDKAVGKDSLALHGQLARPGGIFVMPPGGLAPANMVGMSWSAPPNRPNDRAVLLPWDKRWGIPGWMVRDGLRVNL